MLAQARVSSEIEARDDGKVVGGGFVASLGGVLGDRGGLASGGVDVLDALDEGVTDEDVVDQLVAAIRVVSAGDALIAPAITKRLIEQFTQSAPPEPGPGIGELTPREREVLVLIAYGLPNTEIADELVLSQATVKTHVKRILQKLPARDRAQAVVAAYQAGLVRPGGVVAGGRRSGPATPAG